MDDGVTRKSPRKDEKINWGVAFRKAHKLNNSLTYTEDKFVKYPSLLPLRSKKIGEI